MMNIIISAGEYWSADVYNIYSITVDDIKLLYYSRIRDLAYDSKPLTLNDEGGFNLSLDQFIEDVDLDLLTWEYEGQGKSATVSTPVVDTAHNRIIITVANANGEDIDGLREHTYIIKCKDPEITAITIGGTGRTTDDPVIAYAGYYNPETTAVDATVKGPAEKAISYNEEESTVTVTFTRTDEPLEGETLPEPTVITIQFWKPIASVAFPDGIAAELMTDGAPLTLDLHNLIVTPEDAHGIDALFARLYTTDGEEMGSDLSDPATIATGAIVDGVFTITGRHPGEFELEVLHPDFPDKIFAERPVTVKATPVEAITVKEGQEMVHVLNGASKTITADDYLIISPANAYNKNIQWQIDEANAAAITSQSSSEVTLKGYEESDDVIMLTAVSEANPEIKAEIAIKVDGAAVIPERILWDDEKVIPDHIYYLGETGSKRLTYHYSNKGVNIVPIISWTSVPEGYVDSKGNITVADGSEPVAKVTVTLAIDWEESQGNGISRSYEFEVRQPVTDLKWVDEEGNAITALDFKQHQSPAAEAVIAPANASDPSITYSSSDEAVAIYDADAKKIIPTGFGKAVITASATNDATATNGRTPVEASVEVTIAAMPEEITITGPAKFWVGKSYQLATEITPAEASDAPLTWTIDNNEVATLDPATGALTILTPGSATIKVTAENGTSAILDFSAEEYKGIKRMVGGWLRITDAQGNEEIIETSLDTETTSPSDITLTIKNLIVKGMRLGDISASFEFESTQEDSDGNPTDINFLPSGEAEVTAMRGAISALVAIPSGADGISMGFIDFSKRVAQADFLIAITVPDWDNEKATAIFTTVKPADEPKPDEPAPTIPAGTVTKYPGKMIFEVTPDTSEGDSSETESYTIKAVVTVTDKGETGFDDEGNEVSIVTIDIPEIHFGEAESDPLSRSGDNETRYRYNIPALTLPDVVAKTVGTVTSYIREEGDLEMTDEDGNIAYYVVGLRGTANDAGDARFSLTFHDPAGEESLGGSFANSEDEGEIFSGYLSIEMMGEMVAEDQPATVNIIPAADGLTATFLLPNFALEGIGALGDIRVDDVEIERQDDGSTIYTGSVAGMKLMDGMIEADVDLSGTVDADGNAAMSIQVNWEGIDIFVEFTGERTGSGPTTAIPAIPAVPEAPAADVEPELFTINGVRVNASSAAPGLYIERRGTVVRKIIIR